MRREDLGFNTKTGRHNAVMTPTENRFLGCLWPAHVGNANCMSAMDLAVAYAEKMTGFDISDDHKIIGFWKREVRYLQNHFLREHKQVPILSRAGTGGGYWIAESEEEAAEFYNSFRKRGLTGLVKASRGKQAVLVEMMEQLSFEFDDLLDESGLSLPPVVARPKPEIPVRMVDRFLEKMLAEPERFSDDLRKISQKFGAVLFSKVQARVIKEKVRELSEIMGGMEI